MPASSPDEASTRERLIAGAYQALMTAGAAWISYASSSLIGLREGFWAAISAIVVMHADFTAPARYEGDAELLGWVRDKCSSSS
jgi:uncharacterized membrane protein YccC